MNFIFWQNILSPHQMPYIAALAGRGHSVTVIAEEAMSEDRLKLGWIVPEDKALRVITAPDPQQIRELITGCNKETIHVLAGARNCAYGKMVRQELFKLRRRVGIVSESADRRGWKIFPRWLKYATERFTHGRHFDFILVMGQLGVDWFRYCGYPSERIIEFGYVVEPLELPAMATPTRSHVHLLYVGQLITRKALDKLIIALQALKNLDFCLEIVGAGSEEAALKSLANRLGIDDKIHWTGKLPAHEVRPKMAATDVFILPSYHDGWGAVVNEALMVGTPVICSRECGAASLIQQPYLGATYPAKDSQALSDLLRQRIAAGPLVAGQRKAIRDWARCISPTAMAEYFEKVMLHVYEGSPRPEAPWRINS